MTKRPSTAVRTASLLSTVALTTTLTLCVQGLGESDGRTALAAPTLGGAIAATDGQAVRRTGDRPNILMVTVDDMAIGDLKHMPRIQQQLVDQGTTLTSGIAPTPICVPARASLLTGQYAHNHGALGIQGRHGGFKSFEDGRTLPVWLRRAGYDTMFVGKYLNGYGKDGTRRYVPPGWTSWHGSIDPQTYQFNKTVTNDNGKVNRRKKYNTDGFGQRVDNLLGKPRRTKQPWYMWVNYVAPHFGGPWEKDDPLANRKKRNAMTPSTTSPAPRHRNMFKHKRLPNKPNMLRRDKQKYTPKSQWRRDAQNRRELREVHQQRLEALQAVDEAVGKHIRVLRRTGQLANTMVVFSSDNGYAVGEHNLLGKLWHYEDSLKVPLVVRGPGIPAGRKNATPVTTVDLPVTFAAMAGAHPTREVDGTNVLPAIQSRRTVERVIPIEAWRPKAQSKRRLYSGIRYANQYTYVRLLRGGREELYDLARDPYQLRNVAKVKRYAETLQQMRSLNQRYRDCAGDECPQALTGDRS